MPLDVRNITANRLLAALPPQELAEFSAHLQPVSLSIRRVLHEPNAAIDNVYFMLEGLASILTTMSDGATIEVGMVGKQGMIGVSALLGAAQSSQQVIIQVNGKALRLDAAHYKALFDRSAAVRRSRCATPTPC